MDLIDRKSALSIIRMGMPEETSWSLLYQSVKQLPTVDAVPVTRCKDCRWKLWTHCTRFENAPVTDEDYCSKAERIIDA